MDARTLPRIAPSLGVDLDDRISLIGKHMRWVIALPPFQNVQRGLIQRRRVRPAVFCDQMCAPIPN